MQIKKGCRKNNRYIELKKECSDCHIINDWDNYKCVCGNRIFIIREKLKGGLLD